MTHGVFAGALRDALVFTALIVGGPTAAGTIWSAVRRTAREIRRRRVRRST